MKKTCEDLQIKLLQGASLDQDGRQHLEACADCRDFLELNERLIPVLPAEQPSAEIDQAILAYAKDHKPGQAPLHVYRWIAVAAAAVLLFILALNLFQTEPVKAKGNDVVHEDVNDILKKNPAETIDERDEAIAYSPLGDEIDAQLTAIEIDMELSEDMKLIDLMADY